MRRSAVIAGLLLVTGALAACTSGAGGGARSGAARLDSPGGRAAGGSLHPARPPMGQAAPGKNAADDAVPLTDGSAKIQVAQMSVAVRRGTVAAAADRAGSIALAAGGEIESDQRTSGDDADASLQLRVPPDALPPVLRQLSRLGTEVSRQLSTTDVTEKVADVNSRVESAREAIAGLRPLYARATRVADIIAIEGELSHREADLEALQAQQRALDRQVSMATVTLSVETARPGTAGSRSERGGFLGGLQHGWDGFAAAAGWVATAAGIVLPFAVLLLILAAAARLVWRRIPHRPAPAG